MQRLLISDIIRREKPLSSSSSSSRQQPTNSIYVIPLHKNPWNGDNHRLAKHMPECYCTNQRTAQKCLSTCIAGVSFTAKPSYMLRKLTKINIIYNLNSIYNLDTIYFREGCLAPCKYSPYPTRPDAFAALWSHKSSVEWDEMLRKSLIIRCKGATPKSRYFLESYDV